MSRQELFSMSRRERNRVYVYVVVSGYEYRVNNDNGMADELILRTEPFAKQKDRLSMLDIKGLGLLKYRNRKRTYTAKGNIMYRLRFDSNGGRSF